jgi:hypothetical protein
MADAVSSQTLVDNATWTVIKLTNTSDGTGESAVLKVDVSALTPAASRVTIAKIIYSVSGMVARLLWDATTDVTIVDLQGDGCMDLDSGPCRELRGLTNNAGAGITGDVLLTTVGHTSGDSYSIILVMRKTLA